VRRARAELDRAEQALVAFETAAISADNPPGDTTRPARLRSIPTGSDR
jgi:hypothetical protein